MVDGKSWFEICVGGVVYMNTIYFPGKRNDFKKHYSSFWTTHDTIFLSKIAK